MWAFLHPELRLLIVCKFKECGRATVRELLQIPYAFPLCLSCSVERARTGNRSVRLKIRSRVPDLARAQAFEIGLVRSNSEECVPAMRTAQHKSARRKITLEETCGS